MFFIDTIFQNLKEIQQDQQELLLTRIAMYINEKGSIDAINFSKLLESV